MKKNITPSTITSSVYPKFLPSSDEKPYKLLENAHGKIPYNCTNDYMFQAFLQENNDALKHLVCSIQHLDPASVKSIHITNPIILGKTPEHKTFILDIKAQLHDGTCFNLEMQLEDLKNWKERSLGYLCRSFDNLNKGMNYIDTKAAIHISFLNYSLFPNEPEFHGIYKLTNQKNSKIYTDKFILHVIELKSIHLATKEDKAYGIDKWAAFFQANSWEEINMLIKTASFLQSAAETLFSLNANSQLKNDIERYRDAKAREHGYKVLFAKQKATISKQEATISKQTATISEQTATISEQTATISEQETQLSEQASQLSEKEKENARLKSLLAQHGIADE